jgi:hypothetical protein
MDAQELRAVSGRSFDSRVIPRTSGWHAPASALCVGQPTGTYEPRDPAQSVLLIATARTAVVVRYR